jgi:NHLM bacteriocin system ABC transporter ATP-binding protein
LANWFDEQLRTRLKTDDDVFSNAFADISEVIIGKGILAKLEENEARNAKDAIDEILHYYHVPGEEDDGVERSLEDRLEYVLRPHGIMQREVELKEDWYRDAVGAFLGKTRDGRIIALIPRGFSGYDYLDHATGKRVRVTRKTARNIEPDAICFYRPLPLRPLKMRDLPAFISRSLSVSDYLYIVLLTLLVSLVSIITPQAVKYIYAEVVFADSIQPLAAIFVILIGVSLATTLLNIVKGLMLARVKTKTDAAARTASIMRIISLPADFFKNFSSGELSQRVQYINLLCNAIVDGILSTGLTAVISVIYIGQIFTFAPALVVPAAVVMLSMLTLSIATMIVQMRVTKKKMEYQAQESGILYSFLTGIQKIKLSGSEKRAFAKWTKIYKKNAELVYNAPLFLRLNSVFSLAVSLAGTFLVYYRSIAAGVSVDNYMAFASSYALLSAAFLALSQIAVSAASIRPIFEIIRPILEAAPEIMSGKRSVSRLSGGIELSNVGFRYGEGMPMILEDVSLKINAGEYVAIVGKSGSGKSTLLRLLLGFERPQKGAIYYDGIDMKKIDPKSLRRNIGCVMQNGKLFPGSIYANIVISAPHLTMDDAWKAAEMAGIAEDIRQMPMGMHTLISEGTGGISGGQRQRIIIARAIAPKPKVLFLDEATSALDNITQKIVSESLDSLKCTRIIIAHRLSTIRQCDRILMVEDGKIVEDGAYDELMRNKGRFAALVERQQLRY